jgi:FolB domain-containing protein
MDGDRIGLQVELACIVGILPRERVEPQPLRVAIEMGIDLGPCGESGDLAASVDYGAVDAQVRWLATHGEFRLIESLALAICRLVLLRPVAGEARAPVDRVEVTIEKPTVLRASSPRVTMARGPAALRGDLLIDVAEVSARRVVGARPSATEVLAAGEGIWLALDRRP